MRTALQAVACVTVGMAVGIGASVLVHRRYVRDDETQRALQTLVGDSTPLFLGVHEGDRVLVSRLPTGYLWARYGYAGISYGVEPTLEAAASHLAVTAIRTTPASKEEAEPSNRAVASKNGLRLRDGDIEIVDRNAWMCFAPQAIRVALEEGVTAPDEVLANAFRRMFPEHPWPPPPQSPASETWSRMVTSVARVLERPFVPQLRVIS